MVLDMAVRPKAAGTTTDSASSMVEWTIPAYCSDMQSHLHAQTFEVCYVVKGILAFTLDQHTFTAVENDCVVIRPGVDHCIFNPTATPAIFLQWNTAGMDVLQLTNTMQNAALRQAMIEQYDYFYKLRGHK
jgi:mannose-6-phosphate isomerase-like protein (cupin superfamily)